MRAAYNIYNLWWWLAYWDLRWRDQTFAAQKKSLGSENADIYFALPRPYYGLGYITNPPTAYKAQPLVV